MIRWTRAIAVASLLALIALCVAWELWLAPLGNRTLALKALPLMLPVVGLWKNRLLTYRWVSLLVWVYFIEGAVRTTSDHGPSAVLAGIEIMLCVGLFIACATHIRWPLASATEAPQ